jgi:molecular chaperone GrpE (heat shock protein)
MSLKQPEIESIIDHAVDEILSEVFSDIDDIDHALNYLKEKIKGLEVEDFEE